MNLDSINKGIYPHRPLFKTRGERWIFGLMIAYSLVIYFQIASWYVWGNN